MSDDTDEHEFHVETEAVRSTRRTKPGATIPAVKVSATVSDQRDMELQKIEDDKLLRNAGIPIEGMGVEEKKQILTALRESMPAPESPVPASSPSHPEQVVEEEEEELPEDPLQVLPDRATEVDNEQVCDSTTSTAPPRPPESRTCRKDDFDVESVNHSEKSVAVETRNSRRQKRKATNNESDTCSTTSVESDDSMEQNLLSRTLTKLSAKQREQMKLSSEQKEQSQTRFKDLYNKMNLSLSQQSSDSKSSHPSPVNKGREEIKEVPESSQELFLDCPSEEEAEPSAGATVQKPAVLEDPISSAGDTVSQRPPVDIVKAGGNSVQGISRMTPSPQILTEDSGSDSDGGGTQEVGVKDQGMELDNQETQPPEDLVLGDEEEEEEVTMVADKKEEEEETTVIADRDNTEDERNRRTSPVYLMQGIKPSCSSPKTHSTSRQMEGISPSKLPVQDEKDHRPLLHDNWFSWPAVPPVCCLQRSYRVSSGKRKEPPAENKPYFCPESDTPAEYTDVILNMFDAYFLHFTRMQQCLKKLAWGKPVRAGAHQPDTLDWKKRGRAAHKIGWDIDDDDTDFETDQPPLKRLATERDGPKRKDARLCQSMQTSAGRRGETVTADKAGSRHINVGDAGDTAAALADYDGETQPIDMDDELPDIQMMVGPSVCKGEVKKPLSQSPTIPLGGGSQSSNSLLDDNGDLYCTQMPRQKRRAETENENPVTGKERPKRVCRTVQPFQHRDHGEDNHMLELKPLGRKRKQVSPNSSSSPVCVSNDDDDDDGEVSFPKKVNVGKKDRRFIHISTSSLTHTKNTAKQTVVQPRPRRGTESGNDSESQHQIKVICERGGSYFQPIQQVGSSGNVKLSHVVADVEESDDSVQFVESSSLVKVEEEQKRNPVPQSVQARDAAPFGDDIGVASSSKTTEQEPEEEMIPCPLCNKQFSSSVIQQHAADCNGEEEEVTFRGEVHNRQQPARQGTATSANPLRRRPLHPEIKREDFTCCLCNVDCGGSDALKQHFEKCSAQYEEQRRAGLFADPLMFSDSQARVPFTRSSAKRLGNYRIPKKQSAPRELDIVIQSASSEEVDDIEEVPSDDSCKDPDFALTRDDQRQETEDMKEEEGIREENDIPDASFKPISKLENSPIDFKNQFPKRQQKRSAKRKERE